MYDHIENLKEKVKQQLKALQTQYGSHNPSLNNKNNPINKTQELLLEKISKNTPSILWRVEFKQEYDFDHIFISEKLDQFLGLEEKHTQHRLEDYLGYINSEYLPLIFETLLAVLHTPGISKKIQYEITKATGEKAWCVSSATAYIEDGKIWIYGSTTDISKWMISKTELEKKQKLLLTITENYPNSYLSIIETDYRIGFTSGQEFINQSLPPDSFIGKTLEEIFADKAEFVRSHYQRTFQGEQHSFDLQINNQYQRYKTVPLINESGDITQILVVVENITEQKKAEDAFFEKEIQYRSLFEHTNDAVFFIGLDGCILNVNHQAVDLLGYAAEEMIGKNTDVLIKPEERVHSRGVRKELAEGKQTPVYQRTLIKKDGQEIQVEVNISLVQDKIGKPLYLQSIVRDITDRVHAEKILRESEQRYRTYVENAPFAIFVVDQTGEYLEVNQAACDLTGFSKRELLTMSIRELSSPNLLSESANIFQVLLREGRVKNELVLRKKDGSDIFVILNAVRLTETRFIGFCVDITKEVQAQEGLREREAYFQTLFEYAGDAIFINDLNDRVVEANKRACNLLGYTKEELLQLTIPELQAPENRGKQGSVIKGELLNTTDKPFEVIDLHKNGTRIPVEVSSVPLILKDQNLAISIVRDITDRKQAEEKRRSLEERFRKVFDTSPDAITISDLSKGGYIDVNQGFCEQTGYTKAEVIGKDSYDINIWVNPEDRDLLGKGLRENGEVRNQEVQFRMKNGTIRTSLLSAVILDMDGVPCVLSITRDITERLQAIKAADERREWINTIYRSMNDAVFVHPYLRTGFGNFTEVNEVACKRYGYTREEFLTMGPKDIVHPDKFKELAKQVLGGLKNKKAGLTFETIHVKKSGEGFPVEINTGLIEQSDGTYILAVVRDISERKKAEEKIKHGIDELARLYRASSALLPSRSPDLEPLAQAIVEAILVEFDHTNCSLILVESEQELLNRVAVGGPYAMEVRQGKLSLHGKGLVPKAIRSERIINIPDVTLDMDYIPNWKKARSELVVPLMIEEQVIGVLDVQSEKVNAFSEDDERLMSLFVKRAALAVHSARLYRDAKRRLERLSALRNIDQAITGNLDLNITLEIVVAQIILQLDVDAADILLYQNEFQQLRYAAGSGFRSQTFQFTKLRLGVGCAGKAALERKIIHLENLKEEKHDFCFSPSFYEEEFVEYFGVPLISKGKVIGVLEIFNRKPAYPDAEWMSFMDTLAGQAAIAIDNINMFSKLQISNMELIHAYDSTIEGWAHALELRDMETEGHSRRVVELTLNIARQMGVNDQELLHIRRGALLHDIGKIGVPDRILQKPGPLSEEEWAVMREHPEYAYRLLSPIQYLKPALDIPYSHHERWDGSGYPRGLKGEEIPLAARIFAIVDVWDALLSNRPYRDAWPEEKVINYLLEQSGKEFDPEIVAVFVNYLQQQDQH